MKVEIKEVLTLTHEEKTMINKVHSLMLNILKQINDPCIYNVTKQICDRMKEFDCVVDTEE